MRLTESEARFLLASVPVLRLATVDGAGRPHLVPTTFAVDGDRIHMAVDQKPKSTRSLRRLENVEANPHVAVLADHYEDDWHRLWWVRVDGEAEVRHDAAVTTQVIELLVRRYPQYQQDPPRGPVISITATRWTGWRFGGDGE